MTGTVEVTTRYVTVVDSMPEAWEFVMTYIDKVGDAPTVNIRPLWWYDEDTPDGGRKFEVLVDGMVEQQ